MLLFFIEGNLPSLENPCLPELLLALLLHVLPMLETELVLCFGLCKLEWPEDADLIELTERKDESSLEVTKSLSFSEDIAI